MPVEFQSGGSSMTRTLINTSVVAVENRILLVPLSNMIVRLVLRTDVVFPLTDSRGDANCQVLPAPAGRDAKTGVPLSRMSKASKLLKKGCQTCEFRSINPSNCHLRMTDSVRCQEHAEQRCTRCVNFVTFMIMEEKLSHGKP